MRYAEEGTVEERQSTPAAPTTPGDVAVAAADGEHDVSADRGLLINVAYRMLGSLSDAEDVVQETFTRWYTMPLDARADIRNPPAWCVRVATRICLDLLKSSRHRREAYVGPWLPEPLPHHATADASPTVDPADRITLDESVTTAVLTVLDAMTPAERVSFVLHDVFQYPFAEIGDIVGRSPDACRQLATSARRRLRSDRSQVVDAAQHAAAVRGFKNALERGDIGALIELLDPDVHVVNDGGGQVRAALREVIGAEKVVRFLMGLRRRQPDIHIAPAEVSGRPGLVCRLRGATVAVASIGVDDGLVTRVWMVLNPDKLRFWQTDIL
ncbi:RNA polymerase sigma factor SigJ [Mycolicibacterium parafortuitum]|uniref:ECF subfamily RNA polymerase sigma-24 subunit [Catenulispora acidiphila DSM] n=1 Tax=Mycolicibacterium parafortuitum TaxID=39692 RepID=A0A375YNC2_MYCPF|nr:RNA polymerase sigma factor SigJ [Mycolicibacterium parafortuitum]ORB28611.1 RNA polymerase subunit sigma-24 [Mycolicibacterium parafortuitum]SRX82484.1 ECF subfamily RNA polymerase sigma-24 subunit [Catenulispora acidiphila DSM] [Mycolicibacterium parafortuitum]